jgi:hypothetical protein
VATDFAAYVARGRRFGHVDEFTPSEVAGETFIPGDFVELDGANDWVERAAADPTTIVGISEVDSEGNRTLTSNGKIPIFVLDSRVTLAMSSATQYSEATHRGNTFGITRSAAGHWRVDVAKTGGDARVLVVEGDARLLPNGEQLNIWYVIVLAANLAFDGVAS